MTVILSIFFLFISPKNQDKVTLLSDSHDSQMNNNNWFEISRPFDQQIPENDDFLYSDLLPNLSNTSCINRTDYSKELIRYAGLLPSDSRYINNEKYTLIIGASTSLGEALIRKLTKNNTPFLSINGISDIDFSSSDSKYIFKSISIKEAYIFWYPPLPRYSFSDFRSNKQFQKRMNQYILGLSKFLKERNVPFIFSIIPPYIPEIINNILENSGIVLELPYFIDSQAENDLQNPLIRTYKECLLTHYSNLYVPNLNDPIFPITSDILISFIQETLQNKSTGHYKLDNDLNSQSLLTIKEAIEEMKNQQI